MRFYCVYIFFHSGCSTVGLQGGNLANNNFSNSDLQEGEIGGGGGGVGVN